MIHLAYLIADQDLTPYFSPCQRSQDLLGGNTMRKNIIAVLMVPALMPVGIDVQQSRLFISRDSFNGNLGSLANAETTCNQLANAVGLGEKWRAWVSSGTIDAVNRLRPGRKSPTRARSSNV